MLNIQEESDINDSKSMAGMCKLFVDGKIMLNLIFEAISVSNKLFGSHQLII